MTLQNKIALVTGANSGLGLETTRALLQQGARVLMACRDEQKAQAALSGLRAEFPAAELEFVKLDLASQTQIASCVATVKQELSQLDLLINNAGIMAVSQGWTEDGFERQIGTNHFGHFSLTLGLWPLLSAAPAARVVNLASMAHRWTPGINFDDLDWRKRRYRRWQAYGDSKLANLLFSFGLAQRAADGVTVAAAHPGYASTHLQLAAAEEKRSSLEAMVMRAANAVLAQSAAAGALPGIHAATAADVSAGDYYGPDGFQEMRGRPKKVGCRSLARDPELIQKLWDVSEERTGLSWSH